jgi:hypothetical protein
LEVTLPRTMEMDWAERELCGEAEKSMGLASTPRCMIS